MTRSAQIMAGLIYGLILNTSLTYANQNTAERNQQASDFLAKLPIKVGNIAITEIQFWIYDSDEQNILIFNSPWDEQPGDDVKRDHQGLSPYIHSCAISTLESLETTLKRQDTHTLFKQLTQNGATSQVIVIINGIEFDSQRSQLRERDRDAYFWHWSHHPDKKPVISLSNYKDPTSHWYWEVIATPNACIEPDRREMLRYLQYARDLLRGKSEGI